MGNELGCAASRENDTHSKRRHARDDHGRPVPSGFCGRRERIRDANCPRRGTAVPNGDQAAGRAEDAALARSSQESDRRLCMGRFRARTAGSSISRSEDNSEISTCIVAVSERRNSPAAKIDEALSRPLASENRTSMIDALDMGTGHALTGCLRHLGHGLFFDPTQNHDAWLPPAPLPAQIVACVDHFLHALEARFRQSLKEPRLPRHFRLTPMRSKRSADRSSRRATRSPIRLRRSKPEAARRRSSLGRPRSTMNVGTRSRVSRPRISS